MTLHQRIYITKGFTLIELIIYLALLGIFLSFAVPTGLTIYQHNQQQVIQNVLSNAIRQARLHAMTHGSIFVLAPFSDSKNWSDGIGLYSIKAFKQQPHAKPLYQWHWPNQHIQITWKGFQSQEALYFMPNPAHNAVNGTFLITVAHQLPTKLVVSRLGFVH